MPDIIESNGTSTTTSLWAMNNGIVEACTGVMRLKPILETASKIHWAKEGVKASHADDGESVVTGGEGAIAVVDQRLTC